MYLFPFPSQSKYPALIKANHFKSTQSSKSLHDHLVHGLKKSFRKLSKGIAAASITLIITSEFMFYCATVASAAVIINNRQITSTQNVHTVHPLTPDNRLINVAFTSSNKNNCSLSIVNRALSLQGTPYVFGGTSQNGFDCSGFTKYVFAGSGISLPRTSYAQFALGSAVSKYNLQPGDLVFFSTYAKGASHVGIYMGDGRFVHASNPASGIKISVLDDNFYSLHYLGARRYITGD